MPGLHEDPEDGWAIWDEEDYRPLDIGEVYTNEYREHAHTRVVREMEINGIWIEVPSLDTIAGWLEDGVCEATDGCLVEEDGTCPHGKKSWLVELGII
jgi:hypothetical protein